MNLDITCILLLLNILISQIYFFEVLNTQFSQVFMQPHDTKVVDYCTFQTFFIAPCLANLSDISFCFLHEGCSFVTRTVHSKCLQARPKEGWGVGGGGGGGGEMGAGGSY